VYLTQQDVWVDLADTVDPGDHHAVVPPTAVRLSQVPVPDPVVNPFLDSTLELKRTPRLVALAPNMNLASSRDGYLHFSIPTVVGEEAAWQALNEEHAVPAAVNVQLLRPAKVNAALIGRGEVLRKGRGVLVSEGRVTQNQNLVAVVTVTFTRFVKQEASAAVAAQLH
jgi:hypothetical protein